MRDRVAWRSPLGPLGRCADALLVRAHLAAYLRSKQDALRRLAEARHLTAS